VTFREEDAEKTENVKNEGICKTEKGKERERERERDLEKMVR